MKRFRHVILDTYSIFTEVTHVPKKERDTVKRTEKIEVLFSPDEMVRLKAMAEEVGRGTLRGFVRRAALGEMAAFRRQKKVPEVNRSLYLKLSLLVDLLTDRDEYLSWTDDDRAHLEEALRLIRQVRKRLVGVGDDR